MPHAILRYRLPDEQHEFDAAMQGQRARGILWDIDQHCRKLLKYGEPSEGQIELAEQIRGMIPAEMLD